MNVYRGKWKGEGKGFGIVVSRFNEFITRRLLEGAVEALKRAGVSDRRLDVVWAPGSLEVPFFCRQLFKSARKKNKDALIALACILRGGTYHFECVSHEITRGIAQVSLESGIPVASGIITADNLEQAIERAGLKAGNKGEQAALAALEIADLRRQMTPRAQANPSA